LKVGDVGLAVTDEIIKSWYDPSKQGIIVVGLPRSGTHYLSDLIHTLFSSMHIDVHFNDEIHVLPADNKLAVFSPGNKYSVTSITNNTVMASLFYNRTMYGKLNELFTVIKINRAPMDRLMSSYVKQQQKDLLFHSGMVIADFENISYPIEMPITKLEHELMKLQFFEMIPYSAMVDYENIHSSTQTRYIKNQYPITPRQFFENFDEINDTLVKNIYLYNRGI
jgi:hypothetical protein